MATETLIDNQPSLHDKLPANENKAADEEDALTEVDESKEKKEINEHDETDEGDEGTDGDDEEEDAKGSQLRKEATPEKKSPVTPTSDRPTRERKVVERYSVPSPGKLGKSASSKVLVIEKGRGTQLKDIPNVAFNLSKRKPDDNLNMLHKLLFGKITKAFNIKRNIGQFSGYVWTENEEKQRIKVKERIDKFVKEKLGDFCDVLNIPINKSSRKEELSAKLLEFLEAPHATTDVLLAEKKLKGKKKKTRKATTSKSPKEASTGKSPKEASTETLAKKKKQTPQSGKKRKSLSDVEDDDKAELSDAKDESQYEDVVVANNGTDDEVGKSEEEEEEEEDISKAHKTKSKKSENEGSVAKAEAKIASVKKTSAKATQSSEKSPKKSKSKKSITDHDSASLPKSNQPDTKKLKTGKEKQDTKEKGAIKTSKAGKDQAKGKSRKKNKVKEPSREDMHSVVANILKEVDFNTATLSDILRQLGTHFGLDLMHRKAEVKNIITDVISSMSDEEVDDEEAENDEDGDGGVDEGGDASDEDDNE